MSMGAAPPAATPAPVRLSALREELNLFEAAPHADGSPGWSLHDPVRNQFFRIDWPTFEILARWSMGDASVIAASVTNETALEIFEEDVNVVNGFLFENQLCQMHGQDGTEWMVRKEQASHSNVWQWLLHHYLFFRIPLFKPDRWLSRELGLVAPLFSRQFFLLTAIALLMGLVECVRQWEHFSATLVDTFSFNGAIGYALALTFVKALHELGHAFTAKRKGCRVPTMGLAFLVMWPVAYTDVNEVWKLKSRTDRLAVGAAGIVTELIVAAWATLLWALLPDGVLRSSVFLLATTTWISTIVINASPFMRFDGYFLLSDFLDFPNLHARSFALARWDLRERLFLLGEPVPEVLPRARHTGLVIFAWLVWIYRLSLFLGIAALVYHFFIKLVGIGLFAVEIGVFVVLPLWREISEWRRRAASIRHSTRARRSLLVLGVLLLLGFVPWNTHVKGQGMLRTALHFPIYAPGPARIVSLPNHNGDALQAGQLLMTMESPDLDYRQRQTQERVKNLGWQMEVSGLDEGSRARLGVTREELAGAQAELSGSSRERQRFEMRAPFAGVLADLGPELHAGVWVNRQERLGVLVDPAHWQVETYLDETEVQRVKTGDTGRFYAEASGERSFRLKVIRIDPDATRLLPDPILSVQHGGQIITRERNGQLIPEKAIYRVVLDVEGRPNSFRAQRGQVVIDGKARALLGDYLRSGLSVLIRESGL